MKAIETEFDGYRFRSRSEARWATFFKKLSIPYEYETEGFDLNGTWYLPDFKLPVQNYWIEIKGAVPTEEERKKARLLAIASGNKVFIFHGALWVPGNDDTYMYQPYPGENIEWVEKKGAYCYDTSYLNIIGEDSESICPCRLSTGSTAHTFENCPNTTNLEMGGQYDHLIRALHMAEFSFPFDGDSCKLRMNRYGELQYIVPAHRMDGKNESSRGAHHRVSEYCVPAHRMDGKNESLYLKIPLPSAIKEHEGEFRQLLSTRPPYWEWGVGPLGDLYPEDVYRWCECPSCLKLEITAYGRTSDLSCGCHQDMKDNYPWNTYGEEVRPYRKVREFANRLQDYANDDSPRLKAAYLAARQARFEHR
jgi:hypothetical protein